MIKLKEYFHYIQEALKIFVLSKLRIAFALFLTIIFILINLIIIQYLQIKKILFENLTIFYQSIINLWLLMPIINQILMVIISLLSSIMIILVFMAFKQNQKLSGGASGSGGLILGILAPACPSCGIGIISLIGFGSLGAILPFGGQEIGILALIVLIGSIAHISKQIIAPSCRV